MIVLGDYKLFKAIGKGSFGEVFLTQKGDDPTKLATKCIDLKKINDNIMKYLKNEIEIMKDLNHPNTIHLEKVMQSQHHYFVIMEFCNGGTLSECLCKNGRAFNQEIIQYFMRQIVEGLKYIHSKNIIHRDIKLDNVLINFKNKEDQKNFNLLAAEVKIIDFGLATKLGPDRLAITALGSPINMDPIILKKYDKAGGFAKLQKYNEKADIWSLGTICYEMLTGENLFKANNIQELIAKSERGEYIIPITNDLSNEIVSFINAMLQYDSMKRYSAEELSRHDFLVKNVKDFTKFNLTSISHRVNGHTITLSTKENTTIWNLFNKKDKTKINEWEKYINGLLAEYKAAIGYLIENDLINQSKTIKELYTKISNIKTQYDLGNMKYLKDLPRPITPECIYGCTIAERNKKYNEILLKLRNDKTQLEAKINSFDKNSYKTSNDILLDYHKNISELQRLDNNIKEIENNYNNIWAPPPELIKEPKTIQKEKDYHSNLLKIYVKKVDNLMENLDLIFTIKNNESILFNRQIKLNLENNFNYKCSCKIKFSDWANIENYYLKIENGINSLNNQKVKISLGKIKGGKGITFNSAIPGIQNQIINVTLNPLLFEGKKYLVNEVQDIKILKAFQGKSTATAKIPNII